MKGLARIAGAKLWGRRRMERSLSRLSPRDIEERNIRYLYLDEASIAVNGGITGFTDIFATRLGASRTLLGLMSSVPALVQIFWLLPVSRIVEREKDRLRLVLLGKLFWRLCYFGVALVPWLTGSRRPETVVFLVILTSLASPFTEIAFNSLLADIVPERRIAGVLSIRHVLHHLVTTSMVFIAGKVLDAFPFPINYQGLFIFGFIASVVNLWVLSHLRVPPAKVQRQLTSKNRRPSLNLGEYLQLLRENRELGYFLVGVSVMSWAMSMPGPLYSLYWVRELQLPDGSIGLMRTVNNAVAIAGYIFWGRVTTRYGSRPMLIIGSAGMALYPVLMGLSSTLPGLLVASACGGLFMATGTLGRYGTALYLAPAERRPAFLALYSLVQHTTGFISPLVATTLAGPLGIPRVLFIVGALRVATAVLFLVLPFRGTSPGRRSSSAPS